MALRRNIWWKSVACILILAISDCGSCTIEGTLNGDVVLPCIVPYKNNFKDDDNFVVHWQTSINPAVLHSFYHGMEQLEHQEHRFNGRTQLFPLEFPKGNLSILLKSLNTFDAGNYSCHVYFSDKREDYITHQVELLIKDVTKESDASNKWYIALLVCVPVGLVVIFALRQKKKKSTSEDFCQRFKSEVCQREKSCCTTGQGCMKKDHCLKRELIVLNMTNLCTDISDDFQEAVVGTITSREMFTAQNRKLTSKRMLMVGDAAMGKTCLCEEIELDWKNAKRDLIYKYVIYFTFSELRSFSMPLNVRELLESKCKNSTAFTIDLLRSDTLLIFDGLDMLMPGIEECLGNDDTAMNITTLLSGILTKKLLPQIDVLVTSGASFWRQWEKYFTIIFVLREFAEKDIQKHCELFSKLNGLQPNCYRFIQNNNLSSLMSVPLQNRAFCEICREQDLGCYEGKLDTSSRLFASLLQCTLRNISPEVEVAVEECQVTMKAAEPKLKPNIKTACEQLAELSYKKLITNCQEIKKEELPKDSELLLKTLCKFFLIEQSGGSVFKYRHYSVRDMFATFYCVANIQNNDELKECLDAWAFGEIPTHHKNVVLLEGITQTHQECLHSFIRFFLGFLAYKNMGDILFNPRPLKDDLTHFLIEWLQQWIKRKDTDLLNIFHCVFELHDIEVTRAVSRCFKSVSLCNTQLHSFDLSVMQYSLSEANLEKLDLRCCGLHDGSLALLPIIGRCKIVWLGHNKLGPAGARNLWKSLEKNKSLRVLFLNDNEITDEGMEGMVKSLQNNSSLKELLFPSILECGREAETDARNGHKHEHNNIPIEKSKKDY
ncbi:NACHT, LRR and PYD domains-containing protein 1 homolog isoform X3 [Pleurodeles waltl]|uniref:NACHT, LRR and PYD domains-containing protein 1 homolog isoform X3 n=1 Tax=Pleurodeles waltl TaxID=8319 RepID=UPI0037094616